MGTGHRVLFEGWGEEMDTLALRPEYAVLVLGMWQTCSGNTRASLPIMIMIITTGDGFQRPMWFWMVKGSNSVLPNAFTESLSVKAQVVLLVSTSPYNTGRMTRGKGGVLPSAHNL